MPLTLPGWPARVRARLLERATGASEAPYYRVEALLPQRAADLLFRELLERKDEFRARNIRSCGAPAFYRMSAPLLLSSEFLGRFTELVPALQRRFGTDLGEPEVELLAQAYNDGASFGKHSDADAGGPNWRRRLSGVYYLHAQPRRFDGGRLALYDRRGHPHLVEPQHNSAVFFPRDLFHEVLPVTCASKAFEDSRFAINVWIS
jgi:SM-20-related protein